MTTQHAKSNAREGDGVADDAAWLSWCHSDHAAAVSDETYHRACFNAGWRAAIAAMQAQQGAEPVAWQPIETAPENVEVWLFDPDTDPHQYAALLTERDPDVGGFYWRPAEQLVADMLDYELRPTHWQPLPGAPR